MTLSLLLAFAVLADGLLASILVVVGHQGGTALEPPPVLLAEKTPSDMLACFYFLALGTFLLSSFFRVGYHHAVPVSRAGILMQSSPIWHQC